MLVIYPLRGLPHALQIATIFEFSDVVIEKYLPSSNLGMDDFRFLLTLLVFVDSVEPNQDNLRLK